MSVNNLVKRRQGDGLTAREEQSAEGRAEQIRWREAAATRAPRGAVDLHEPHTRVERADEEKRER